MPLLLASHGNDREYRSVAAWWVFQAFAYCATKGAVVAMTRQIAVAYPTQIRANCICPGTVDLPSSRLRSEKYHKHEKEKVRAETEQRQPLDGWANRTRLPIWRYISAPPSGFCDRIGDRHRWVGQLLI